MDLIDKYNGLGSLVNDLDNDELQNITGVNFDDIDFNLLDNNVYGLYDQFVLKLKDGTDQEKIEAKYTLSFLIILFSYHNTDGGHRKN